MTFEMLRRTHLPYMVVTAAAERFSHGDSDSSGTKCQNEPIVISVTNHCPNKNIQKVQLFVICCIFVIELILLWLKINDDKNKYHETKS
ncbi:hypothetical protein [Bracoviriform inaniti]|uniref:Uncharacterized protein n=1 Tax=Bracoviriform inaniti TaxID=36344 RepID=Q8UZC7_9VIRU|nr:hypothetical protein [Bracoviriform inaniti]CAC82098.2 hypothetical protein [Bracoviriform inaniti]